MITKITSGRFSARIDSLGAELKSLTDGEGREFLWCGDPSVWKGVSPVLFPVIGTPSHKRYTVEGLVYRLERHGFARLTEWQAGRVTENEAEFTLSSSDATRKIYPYDFVLTALFTLENGRLTVRFTVRNTGEELCMYYMLGAHTAFATEGGAGLSECRLRFCEKAAYGSRRLDGKTGLLLKNPEPIFEGDTLALSSGLFDADALIFDGTPGRTVWLERDGRPSVRVDYPNFPVLGVWTARGTDRFVCIEPWTGLPESQGAGHVLAQKHNLRNLAPGKSESFVYSITIEE